MPLARRWVPYGYWLRPRRLSVTLNGKGGGRAYRRCPCLMDPGGLRRVRVRNRKLDAFPRLRDGCCDELVGMPAETIRAPRNH